MDLTPANLQIFYTGLSTAWQEGYTTSDVWFDRIASMMPSGTSLEQYGWMDFVPQMKLWNGPRQLNNLVPRTRTIVNQWFEDSIRVPKQVIVDDQYGLYGWQAIMLGRAVAKYHDTQLVSLIQSNPTGFDGVTFFGTTHPTDLSQSGSATQANDFPTNALNPSNFSAMRASMRGFKGRDLVPFGSNVDTLLAPPQLEESALNIANSDFFSPQLFGSGAGPNETQVGANSNILKGTFEPVVIEEFSNQPKIWYGLQAKSAMPRPFIVQIRQAPNLVYLMNPTDPNVFFNNEFIMGVDARSAYDVALWWRAARAGSGL